MNPTSFSVLLFQALLLVPTSWGDEAKPTVDAEVFRAAAGKCLKALRTEPIQGLPNEAQMRRLAPMISPGLMTAFRQAATIRDREASAEPDEKPPWVEGDFFSSLTEGVTSWELGKCHVAPSILPSIDIQQSYKDAQGNAEQWTDRYVFIPHDDTWILEDILMGGHWAVGGTLRGSIPGGLREEANHISFDQKWLFTFVMEGDAVARIAVQAAENPTEPQILFQESGDRCLSFRTHVIWSADSKRFALRLGEGPHSARTKVYALEGSYWKNIAMPDFFKKERDTALGNGFEQIHDVVEPLYWRDDHTLVLGCVMSWEKGEEGDGLGKMVTIELNKPEPVIQSILDLVSPSIK